MYETAIFWTGKIPYSFTDKNTGEHREGASCVALAVEYRDGVPYRADKVKCTQDFSLAACDIGKPITPFYDRFGRLCGYQVI